MIMKTFNIFFAILLFILFTIAVKGQDEPVIIEAESGTAGADLNIVHPVIYPNPVTDGKFCVQGIEDIIQVKVFSLMGIQVASLDGLNQPSPVVSINAAPGTYIIRCYDGQKFYFGKIILK
jgi:hypothetical protein